MWCKNASKWKVAMQEKYNFLIANKTYELTFFPKHCKSECGMQIGVLHQVWCNGPYCEAQGKASSQGVLSSVGVNSYKTFILVAKFTTDYSMYTCTQNFHGFENHQMDVKRVFLNQ